MRLTQVNNFVDYARAINYLESLSAIHHANVISIDRGEIVIRLVADGQLPQLKQAFALDKRLLMQTGLAYQGEYPISLDYRWPTTQEVDATTSAKAVVNPAADEAVDASSMDFMDDL